MSNTLREHTSQYFTTEFVQYLPDNKEFLQYLQLTFKK